MFFFWKSGDVFYGSSGYNMTVRAQYDISRRPSAVQKRLTLRSNLLVEFLRGEQTEGDGSLLQAGGAEIPMSAKTCAFDAIMRLTWYPPCEPS